MLIFNLSKLLIALNLFSAGSSSLEHSGAMAAFDTTVTKAVPPANWCDSTVWTDTMTPGGRKVPIVACSATPAESTALHHAFVSVSNALTLYSRLIGVPYPWPRYVMQVKPDRPGLWNGGQATGDGTMVFYGPLPDPRTEHDRPDVTSKILVHELAHQWSPEYNGGTGSSGWLSEGFSDFMTAQTWGATQGARGEEEFLFFYNTDWSDAGSSDSASRQLRYMGEYAPYGWYSIPWPGAQIWNKTLDNGDDVYYRGAMVLWMLQQYLGDTRFWASIHTYMSDSAKGQADSRALKRAIQTTTGEDLGWFFKEWVNGKSYPHFTVAATYNSAAHDVTLHVAQSSPTFRMPVAVRVGTAHGDVIVHDTLDSATQTIVVQHVASEPKFVLFDDGDAILKTLQFEQPTAWLAAQLERDARPWQTWWAIEQLRPRAAHDQAAASALIQAGLRGRYSLTRAQAMIGLSGLTTPTALTALKQGVRDTAVIVRRGALLALESIGTAAALQVQQWVFTHDASDVVRADAIQSLLLSPATSPAERQKLFAQALAQQTYRDVVQKVATKVMTLNSCDSSTAATLHAALATPGVTRVLKEIDPFLAERAPACRTTLAGELPQPDRSH